jgi:transcriptional regulator with XRE-family HTH domain
MLSETLQLGLREYEIGEKVRALRLRKKMGLVELGKHTGLSPALLSKIERSKLFPPLPTLLRIALVFNVGLEHFFTDDRKNKAVGVVRRGDRKRFPDDPEGKAIAWFFECLDYTVSDRKMNAYHADFQVAHPESSNPHVHDGVEFLYVTSGTLALKVGRSEHELASGDAIYFDSTVPHSYAKVGEPTCTAVVITVP